MKTSEKVNISLRKLVGLPNNPRKITQADLNKLCDSIRNNGYWEHRPAAVEPIEGTDTYTVLDGNHLLMAQRISGLEHPNLCVYGGGDDIRQWCHEKGVLHVQEYMNNRMREKG